MRDKLFEEGLKVRKKVLSAEYVERQLKNADEFMMPIQELATKAAWGLVWTRPGLPLKVRSMLNIGMLVALGKEDELELHLRAAVGNGVSKKEIQEILLQTAMYCGFPAALNGFRSARKVLAELERDGNVKKPARSRKNARKR
jgi:4-carboxymuconolactone decarboxylase